MKKRKISEQAVDFILTRRNEELKSIKVEEIARILKANRSYLSRSFKVDQSISLTRFILREKIHRAIFLIENGYEKTMAQLSTDLGFFKLDNFVNEFRHHLAIDPDRYRELRRKVNFH